MRRLRHIVTITLIAAALIATRASAVTYIPSVMGTYATVPSPLGLAFDGAGNLYVTSSGGRIYKVSPGGGAGVLFATTGADLWGLVCDPDGNVFVADRNGTVANGGRIWKVTPAGVATAFKTGLAAPFGLARDASGNLYASLYNAQKIIKITPAGVVSDYATGLGVIGNQTYQIDFDADGNLYAGNEDRILKIGPGGSPVTQVVGNVRQALGFVRWIEDNFIVSTFGFGRLLFAQPRPRGTPAVEITSITLTNQCTDGVMPEGARVNQTAFLTLHEDRVYVADQGCNRVRSFPLKPIEGPTAANKQSWGRIKAMYR